MAATIRLTISLQPVLYEQAESLARQLELSAEDLCGLALQEFIDSTRQVPPEEHRAAGEECCGHRLINQGDLYWARLDEPAGAESNYAHPYVVIQENVINHSRVHTVVVCALTSNLRQAGAPGNILLEAGEGGLPKQSVVVVSKVSVAEKAQLGACIGSLGEERVRQILAGMRFLQLSMPHRTGAEAD